MTPNGESRRIELLAQSWRRTLAGLPTLPARLEYLASLRNAHSGHYEHFGLSQKAGAEQTEALLRETHMACFQEWLCLDQAAQLEQTRDYLDGLPGDKREIVANWLALRPFSAWVPAESRDAERELFLTDLDDVVEAIRAEYQVASRDPER